MVSHAEPVISFFFAFTLSCLNALEASTQAATDHANGSFGQAARIGTSELGITSQLVQTLITSSPTPTVVFLGCDMTVGLINDALKATVDELNEIDRPSEATGRNLCSSSKICSPIHSNITGWTSRRSCM